MIVRSFRSLADAAEADVVADDVCKSGVVEVLHDRALLSSLAGAAEADVVADDVGKSGVVEVLHDRTLLSFVSGRRRSGRSCG